VICYTHIPSPLGTITLASDGRNLTGLWMEGQKYFPNFHCWRYIPTLPLFYDTARWLEDYFAGLQPDPKTIPIAPSGSAFQHRVWNLLRQIPYGELTSYGTLAKKLNCRSAQAVGNAIGKNPISILIPCHRVVGKNGQLTGYAGGLDRKLQLLELEKSNR